MTRFLYSGAVGLILLGALPLVSRQAAEQASAAVIRVTVNLVQLDATVTDSKGRHIADLKSEDFEILEDGKRQKITQFAYVPGPAPDDNPAPINLPPQSDSGKLPEAIPRLARALRPEEVHRTIVLMADDLGLTPGDIADVRKTMKSFVDREMQTGDLAAVMTTSGCMGVMQQLTNDKRQLNAAIDRIHYFAGSRPGWTWYTPNEQPTADRMYQKAIKERLDAARSPGLSMGTFGALAYAIHGLGEMPGRKAIAFFSDGLPQSADGIVQLANRASVVIYTLDPRGFVSFDATALDAGPEAGGLKRAAERQAAYQATQTSLDQLARGTGGIFVHDDNNLAQGLAAALDDMRGYYLIG